MARYVDEVRAIGATPILVTSLVRRTFKESRNLSDSEPARLVSTLGPWVEAVRRLSIEKRVPLIDLDASSRALCERLGPVQTAGFNIKKDDGTWDTTHLDAAGSAAFARLVVDDLRDAVPALAPYLPAASAQTLDDPPDLPAPHPLLSTSRIPIGLRVPFGRVYTRAHPAGAHPRREAFHGRAASLAALPPMVTSPVDPRRVGLRAGRAARRSCRLRLRSRRAARGLHPPPSGGSRPRSCSRSRPTPSLVASRSCSSRSSRTSGGSAG